MKRIACIVFAVAGIALLILSPASCKPASSPEVGSPAPDFTLPTLDGQTVKLSDFKGQPVFINFWATWCPPCLSEMPHIQAVFDDEASKGLVVLAVNVGEEQSTARHFIEQQGYTFPIALDVDGSIGEKYRVRAYPTSLFIDPEGVIRSIKVGSFQSEAQIRSMLEIIR